MELTGCRWWVLIVMAAAAQTHGAEPVRLSSDARSVDTVEVAFGNPRRLEIAPAKYPRLLILDEREANIEIVLTTDDHDISIDNRVGRNSQEWLYLDPKRHHSLLVVYADGPATGVRIGLTLRELNAEASGYWQRLGSAFFSTADPDTAVETMTSSLTSTLLDPAQAQQLRYSLALYLINRGRLDEASAHLDQLVETFAGDWRARVLVDLAQISFRRGDLQTATQRLEAANAVARQDNAVWTELVTAGNRCRLLQTQGEASEARACTVEVLGRAVAAGEPKVAATLEFNLGGLEVTLANPAQARQAFENALRFFDRSDNLKGQGDVAAALALLERRLGRLQRALAFQAKALDAYRQIDERHRIALSTTNLAGLYLSLGDIERARPLVEESAALAQQLNDLRQWRRALAVSSLLESQVMNDYRSEVYRRQALSLAQEIGDESLVLSDRLILATTLIDQNRLSEAATEITQAKQDLSAAPNLAGAFQSVQGRLLWKQGELAAARTLLFEALQTHERTENRQAELDTLTTLTELELGEDNAKLALDWLHKAREVIQASQLTFNDPGLRPQFARRFARIAELELEAVLATGGGDLAARSFVTAERNRAGTLIDLLTRTDAVPPIPDVQLQQQLTASQERLALTLVQLEAARQFDPQRVGPLTRTVRDLRQEVELTEARVAAGYPQFPASSVPDIELANLQAQLSDNTWLIAFSLADNESLAWRITGDSVELFRLAPRQQLEALARDVHRSINPPRAKELVERRLADLGEALLAPFAGEPPPAKLLIVADGALHYVPFAAVPWPDRGAPLVEFTEIVHLASAQAALLQRRVRPRAKADKTLLVIADPVFDVSDGRLPNPTQRPGLNLSRLTQSRVEARQIAALIEPGQVDVWLDFMANRDSLLNTKLTRYEILHLATHASADSAFPELSGLTLSTMDASGRAINGFVGLRDLFRLQGSADLVVLSACDTALGSEVRGEGLVSLTRGFLYAGARQVIGTLWPVEDRSNTALMLEFYKAMVEEGVSAGAALRASQRTIRRQPGRSHPFYWAGVALYGDWE